MRFPTHRLQSISGTYVTQSGVWGGPQMHWKECNRVDERHKLYKTLSAREWYKQGRPEWRD